MTGLLHADAVRVGYHGHEVLRGVDLCVDAGQRWAVIGRNGAGKSTFIKVIAGLLRPVEGHVLINGRSVREYPARRRAREIAYVPQKPEGIIPYTVQDFVMLGRYSLIGLFGMPGDNDKRAVDGALDSCDVLELRRRMMTTLSGGEVQRVLLAGALAQEAPLLLLDEPTTFLDPAHERLFFRALHSAHRERNLTTVMVTHDINTALASCTHILALLDGEVHFAGEASRFRQLCPEVLREIYGISFATYAGGQGRLSVYGTWEKS